MTVTMIARLTRNAKMAKGMLITVIAMSLTYTDRTLVALRIKEGKHSTELSWLRIVLFAALFESSGSVLLNNLFMILLFLVCFPGVESGFT